MAGEPNQIKWRGVRPTDPEEDIPVKQDTPANLKATVDVAAGQEIEVTQETAADLKATVNIAANQTVEVTQGTPTNLVAQVIGHDTYPIKIKQNIPANLKATVNVAAGQEIEVTQGTPADLKATVIGDDATPIKVKQDTAANLKVTICDSYESQDSKIAAMDNPTNNAILIDTGPLAAGRYDFSFLLSCTVNHKFFYLEHRNTVNNATLHRYSFVVGDYKPLTFPISNWNIAANERFRAKIINDVIGQVDVCLWWTRRT